MGSNLYSIAYNDLLSFSKQSGSSSNYSEFEHVIVQNDLLGKYQEKIIKTENYEIRDVAADLNNNLRVDFLDIEMKDSFNICLCVGPSYEVLFNTHKMKSQLTQSKYHFNYVPDSKYQLNIQKQVHSIHLAIENGYYTNLLRSLDISPNDLMKRFARREPLNSSDVFADSAMKKSFYDIFNNPLTGKIKELFIEAKVLEIISLQLNQIIKTNDSPESLRKKDIDIFYGLKEFLDNTLTESHSLRGLSVRFGINEFKLKKGFRQIFGTSIFNYILLQRMELSHKLILEGGLKVNEVSVMMGYKNANHFSTAFKNKFGISPTSIKK